MRYNDWRNDPVRGRRLACGGRLGSFGLQLHYTLWSILPCTARQHRLAGSCKVSASSVRGIRSQLLNLSVTAGSCRLRPHHLRPHRRITETPSAAATRLPARPPACAVLRGFAHLRGVRAGRPGPPAPRAARLLRHKGHQLLTGTQGGAHRCFHLYHRRAPLHAPRSRSAARSAAAVLLRCYRCSRAAAALCHAAAPPLASCPAGCAATAATVRVCEARQQTWCVMGVQCQPPPRHAPLHATLAAAGGGGGQRPHPGPGPAPPLRLEARPARRALPPRPTAALRI